MNYDHLIDQCKTIADLEIQRDFPMSTATTFRAGGQADLYLAPQNIGALRAVLSLLRQQGVPFLPLGGGSNLLVRDGGYRGAMVALGALNRIAIEGEVVYAQCGAKLSAVCREALGHALLGLEFAGGIPGTVGGGVYMNAGAYGGEIKDIFLYADVLHKDDIARLTAEQMAFSYRHSAIMEREDSIILGAAFRLKKGDAEEGLRYLAQLNAKRRDKQPTDMPSAGSTFKRVDGYFAAALIEQAGLKGFGIGGAQVSQKHSGFIVNRGGATAKDITDLIAVVQKTVKEKFGVVLPLEVRIVGEEG